MREFRSMRIYIEIPIAIDGQLDDQEFEALQQHIEQGIARPMLELRRTFNTEPRMLGTICRFRFEPVQVDIK